MSTRTTNTAPEAALVEAYLELDPISVCSRLIAALKDAAHGWRVAAEAVESELGEAMRAAARRREHFAVELSNVVSGRSGQVTDVRTMSGHLLTWWLRIRAATAGDTEAAVLAVCKSGSEALLGEYREALETTLPDPIRDIIVRQLDDIEATNRWLSEVTTERA